MKWMRSHFVAAVLLCLLVSLSAMGQTTTATLQGTVKDASGSVIPGASLTIHNLDTNQTIKAASGSDGTYRFESIAVGNYEMRVEQPGFKTAIRTQFTLTVAQQAVADISLEIGEVSQQVDVTTDVPIVNTSDPTLGATVNEQQVSDLPLNGRNYAQLALLQPGITEQKNRNATATASLASQGTYYSSNGAPIRSNRYLLDGTNLSEYGGATASSISGTTLGIDGIREFKLLTDGFDAQFGMSMGSQMLVVSKGGTNAFHGDAFDFLRNEVLDARNYFDTAAGAGTTMAGAQRRLPPFRRNNFGGAFGGPIRKDKTFIFGVYEGIRELQGLTKITSTVPAGCRGAAGAVITPAQCSLLTANQTVSPIVAPWLTASPLGSLAPIFPLPNFGTNQVSWSYGSATHEDYGQGRVDEIISAKDNIFGRYTIDNDQTGLPAAQPGFATFPTSRGQWATIAENHIFSGHLLNTITFGYSRDNLQLGGDIYYNGAPYAYISNGTANETGSSGFEMGGLTITGVATNTPGGTVISQGLQSIYSYSDDLYYTKGRHSLKFGTLINHYQIKAVNGVGTTGSLTFLNMTNFLNAKASSYALQNGTFDDRLDLRYDTLGFYVQDAFKIKPRFTLSFGLRYEPNTDMVEIHGKASSVRNFLLDAQPSPGRLMMQDPSWHNFSPRLGFAWDPFGDGKTAIRGAFSYLQNVGSWLGIAHSVVKQLPNENPITITAPTTAGISFTIPFTVPASTSLPLTTRTPTLYNYYAGGQLPAAPGNQQPRGIYYNVSVQRQFPWSMAATLAYTGSRNWGLLSKDLANIVIPTGIPGKDSSGNEACVAGGGASTLNNLESQVYTDGRANTCYAGTESWYNQNWGNITAFEASGQSWYNSLQASLDKQLKKGLQFQAAFTWSRLFDTTQTQSVDDGGNGTSGFVLDPLHPERDRGPADFDVPITFRFNLIYNLPKIHANRIISTVANGWRVSPIYQAQSGSNFDLGLGTSRSLPTAVGAANDRPNIYAGRTPSNIIHGTSAGCNGVAAGTKLGTRTLYYDPCAFYVQPRGFEGNMTRNSIRGPSFNNVDLSLVKDTSAHFLGEAGMIEFRAEDFNIFNHANFATPSRQVFSGNGPSSNDINEAVTSNAGAITTTIGTSRQIQLAVKVIF